MMTVFLYFKKSAFAPKEDILQGAWMIRDIEKIARTTNSAPFLIEADAKSCVPNGPLSGQTEVNPRNDHISYIITWYSLSFLTMVLFCKRIASRMPYQNYW